MTHVWTPRSDEWALINPISSVIVSASLQGVFYGSQASFHSFERRAVEAFCTRKQASATNRESFFITVGVGIISFKVIPISQFSPKYPGQQRYCISVTCL